MFNTLKLLLSITMMYSTPLVFGALGGVISEKSGVVNIGIEGMMTIGAFAGAAFAYSTGNPWLGFLMSGVAGAIFGLIHAIASVSFKADQTVSGIAINMIGGGMSLFVSKLMFDGATMTPTIENKLPKVGSLEATVIIAFAATILMWVYLYKTKWGLRLLAVGEHPAAADTLGINVYKTRYLAVIASGFLAGLGGGSVTLSIVSQFSPTSIAGQGFIALAAVIFGKWTPHGAYGAALIFAFAQALTIYLGGDFFIPSQILSMFPYILTIVILVIFVGSANAPKADGIPYEKGRR